MRGSHVIQSGDSYTVIATDDDGDGFYDDVHYVHTIPGDNTSEESVSRPDHHDQARSGQSPFSQVASGAVQINWKAVGIIFASGIALAIIGFAITIAKTIF